MTYTICKTFTLSYSHQLTGLPDGHQCGRVHGHNGVVTVFLASPEVDNVGFVMDYGKLAPLQTFLNGTMDHRHLNDVVPFNPTAENLARYVFEWCSDHGWPVTSVGWSETPKTDAWYTA